MRIPDKRMFFLLMASALLASLAKAQEQPPVQSRPIETQMIELLLEKGILSHPGTMENAEREILRAQELAREALSLKPQKHPGKMGEETTGPTTFDWVLSEPGTGIQVTLDEITGLGTVNAYDSGDTSGLPLDIAVPTIISDDNEDLFNPPDEDLSDNEDLVGSHESAGDNLPLEPIKISKKVEPDPYFEPTIMTEQDFSASTGSLIGFWKVDDEIWHIGAGEREAVEILTSSRDMKTRIDEIEGEIRRLTKKGTIHVWERASGPIEKVRQQRFKRLDIDVWNYLGEEMDPEIQGAIDGLVEQRNALTAMLGKTPEDRKLDPSGFGAMQYQGAQPIRILSVDGDCDYEMQSAFFDGRTLGAQARLDEICALNDALPHAIKQQLLAGAYPRTTLSMLRVTMDPRSRQLQLKGRYWSRDVRHDSAGTKINSVSELYDKRAISATRLTPLLPDEEQLCTQDYCQGHSCDYNSFLMQSFLKKQLIFEQYLQALHAEAAAVSELHMIQLGNSKRSAARLEAARNMTHLVQVLDEAIGALVEINGILAAMHDPGAWRENPFAVWESIKDVNALINRAENAMTDLDKNVESIRYVVDPDATTEADIFDRKSRDDLVNLKELIEDPIIDQIPRTLDGLSKALGDRTIDVPGIGPMSLKDAINLERDFHKNQTSNIIDALAFTEPFREAGLRKSAQNHLRNATRLMKSGDVKNAKKQIRLYGRQQDASLGNGKRAAAFATVQIALRLVKTRFTEKPLREMRERILRLRAQISPVTENARKHAEDLLTVEDQIADFNGRLEAVRQALSAMRPCFSQKCGAYWRDIEIAPLPEPRMRPNGTIAFGSVKARLDADLNRLELQGVQALELELSRPKSCSAEPDLFARTEAQTGNEKDEPDEEQCAECARLSEQAEALQSEIDFLQKAIAAKTDVADQIRNIQATRQKILDEMETLQARYVKLVEVGKWHDNSGWYNWINVVDARYRQGWANLSDAGQTKLADIHNEVLEKGALLQNLKRKAKLLASRQNDFETHKDRLVLLKQGLKTVQADMAGCANQTCK